LCHVAAGFTDAMLEITPGWQVWDLLPGHHILRASGGSVISLDGSDLSFDLGIHDIGDVERSLENRRTFVAAGTATLAREISRKLVDEARP
jgi:myo-inositol-1(or 4)-monophosphatase